MGKTRRGHKEFTKEQHLKYENQKMRREIASLRKQLARLDLDRHSYVKDILDEHFANEEHEETTSKMLQRLKDEWACKVCQSGYLEINTYYRAGEVWYYRKCNNETCKHRTKGKLYDPNAVRGPIRKSDNSLK